MRTLCGYAPYGSIISEQRRPQRIRKDAFIMPDLLEILNRPPHFRGAAPLLVIEATDS